MQTEENMTPTCRLIIRELRDRHRRGYMVATVNDLIQGTGSCESTVRKNLRRLVNLGEVTAERRTNEFYARPDTTLYRLPS